MSTFRKIKPLEGYANVSDAEIVTRATAVQTKMTGNSSFPNPPVDLAALKTAIDDLSALMAEALDGSKKVIAQKNKQREAVIKMLRLLGRYVEIASKDDMATFQTSGFPSASTTKTAPEPLSETIRKIEHGANSGQVLVWLRTNRSASSYELRYAPAVNGATPSEWTAQGVALVKTPVNVTGLAPGAAYAFQARALTRDGYTDWSDSITLIAI